MQLGIAMAVREFTCLLCNLTYTRMTGDLITPGDETCGQCFEELTELPIDERIAEIARRLQANAENLGERYRGEDWVEGMADFLARQMGPNPGDVEITENS